MAKVNPACSPVYPLWVLAEPMYALQLLAGIRNRLRTGQELEQQDIEYLCDAIGGILGDGLTKTQRAAKARDKNHDPAKDAAGRAAKALYLVRSRGQKSNPMSLRNIEIYNYVQRQIELGETPFAARISAAHKFRKRDSSEDGEKNWFTEDGIDKICKSIDHIKARARLRRILGEPPEGK